MIKEWSMYLQKFTNFLLTNIKWFKRKWCFLSCSYDFSSVNKETSSSFDETLVESSSYNNIAHVFFLSAIFEIGGVKAALKVEDEKHIW